MKSLPPPNDPWALQARIMDAVIGDILDPEARRTGTAPRWNAMREVRKQRSGK